MVDVICEASVSQLSDISTLDSITFLQRTNVTRYRKCHLKKAARNQRFHLKAISCNTPVYRSPVYGIEQTRKKKRACHCEMGLAKRTSLKKNIHDSLRSQIIFVLHIYTNHTNDLFWIKNGEFHRKVTSLHPGGVL